VFAIGHTTPAVARELDRFAAEGPMTGPRLASILHTERSRWNVLLAQVGAERMELPVVEGTWSVKELVAHLTWYERAVVEGARQVLGGGSYRRSGMAGLGLDERNARIAADARSRKVAEVLTEAERVFDQLAEIIAACPQDPLNDPRRLGLPKGDDRLPWMLVADNAYAHYRLHEQPARAWLAQMSTRTSAQAAPAEPGEPGEDET
jgi:DinB family protein